MIELYHSLFSTCSQKVRICLAEKALDYKDCRMSFANGDHLTAEYLKLNPNGVVPTIVHDGVPVIDSSVICEYLDEVFPEPPLMPADPLGRARVRAVMRYLEEVPTTAIRVPSFNTLFAPDLAAMGEEAFKAHAARLPLRKHFYQKMNKGRFSDEERDASLERLAQTIARAEMALAAHKWLADERFTLADILLIPTIIRMEDIGLSEMWADAPHVAAWLARVKARPSFARAYPDGARVSPETFAIGVAEKINTTV